MGGAEAFSPSPIDRTPHHRSVCPPLLRKQKISSLPMPECSTSGSTWILRARWVFHELLKAHSPPRCVAFGFPHSSQLLHPIVSPWQQAAADAEHCDRYFCWYMYTYFVFLVGWLFFECFVVPQRNFTKSTMNHYQNHLNNKKTIEEKQRRAFDPPTTHHARCFPGNSLSTFFTSPLRSTISTSRCRTLSGAALPGGSLGFFQRPKGGGLISWNHLLHLSAYFKIHAILIYTILITILLQLNLHSKQKKH